MIIAVVLAVTLYGSLATDTLAGQGVHQLKRLPPEKRSALAQLLGQPIPPEPPVRSGRIPQSSGASIAPTPFMAALKRDGKRFDEQLRRAGLLLEPASNRHGPTLPAPAVGESGVPDFPAAPAEPIVVVIPVEIHP